MLFTLNVVTIIAFVVNV